jgi:hypothetical protein
MPQKKPKKVTLWCVCVERGVIGCNKVTLKRARDGSFEGPSWTPGVRVTLRGDRISLFPGYGPESSWKLERFSRFHFWTHSGKVAVECQALAVAASDEGGKRTRQRLRDNVDKLFE